MSWWNFKFALEATKNRTDIRETEISDVVRSVRETHCTIFHILLENLEHVSVAFFDHLEFSS